MSEYRTVAAAYVPGSATIPLTATLGADHPAGSPVVSGALVPAGSGIAVLTVDALTGETSLTVSSAVGIVAGAIIVLGATSYVVDGSYVPGSLVVPLTSPLRADYPAGTGFSVGLPTPGAFLRRSIAIGNKAGVLVGYVTSGTIDQPRSRMINKVGTMRFHVNRVLVDGSPNPDLSLIARDRTVLVTSNARDDPWLGTILPREHSGGVGVGTCECAFSLLTYTPVKVLDTDAPDGTNAGVLYRTILDQVNAYKSSVGELTFQLDIDVSSPVRGDYSADGEAWQALSDLAARSDSEMRWRAALVGNQFVVTFVARDRIVGAQGIAFTDGMGPEANVLVGSVRAVSDASARLTGVKLTGAPTRISERAKDWADQFVHEVEPWVEVIRDPGEDRARVDKEVRVDFSLSAAAQDGLAHQTEDTVWEMYHSFLRAWHDLYGRPFVEGYKYEGPPDDLVQELTHDKYSTRLELLRYGDLYVSGVMLSSSRNKTNRHRWLIVYRLYGAGTGEPIVKLVDVNHVYEPALVRATFTAGTVHHLWDVSAGVVIGDAPGSPFTATGSESWEVDSGGTTVRFPDGSRRSLRIVHQGPFIGRWLDPSESGVHLAAVAGEPAFDGIDVRGALIDTILHRERPNISNWDPRSDGVGALLNTTTVWWGRTTTRARWHVVPWGVPQDAETTLSHGISISDTFVDVDSVAALPTAYPYEAIIDGSADGSLREEVKVLSAAGGHLRVVRGQNGTIPIAHASGSTFRLAGEIKAWDGFEFPWTWPEGEAYANELLDRLARQSEQVALRIANRAGGYATVDLGSTHSTNVRLEGPSPGGIVLSSVRVVGIVEDELSPDGLEPLVERWID